MEAWTRPLFGTSGPHNCSISMTKGWWQLLPHGWIKVDVDGSVSISLAKGYHQVEIESDNAILISVIQNELAMLLKSLNELKQTDGRLNLTERGSGRGVPVIHAVETATRKRLPQSKLAFRESPGDSDP
ncbi:hypothetical protein Golax_004001 [Gossypium laxum]|uniref:RNase H type-1 domain-containing protein n=1 Tax=Gossypium laxum TaxID=34288 RepID=A0A7J9AHK2_9ROSI|nr:hypothetical protein [Gossypium laxum]